MKTYKNFRSALIALLGAVMFYFTACKEDTLRSNACEIVSFTAGGEAWTISGTNITKTFPTGTDVTALAPTITVSAGATVNPASGAVQNFSQDVTYTVTAADGTTKKAYTAKATVAPPDASDACDITAFTTEGGTWTIDGTNITGTFPAGTEVTALTPTITLSEGATVDPASGVAKDFFSADGVVYTVTAEDGTTTKEYTVKATVQGDPFSGTTGDCTWRITGDEDNYTLTISGSGAMGDATWSSDDAIRYGIKTIIVEDGVTRISDGAFSDHQNVTSASIPNSVTSIGAMFFWMGYNLTSVSIPPDLTAIPYGFLFKCGKLTSVTIPVGVQSLDGAAFADLLSLTTVTCLNPVPPTIPDDETNGGVFRPKDTGDPNPAVCTLKVPAGSVQAYKNSTWGSLARFADIVAIDPSGASDACDITAFTTDGGTWTINGANITGTLPAGTEVTALEPTITLSAGATVTPTGAQDFSAAEGVTYTVTAEDGETTKTYTAKATVQGDPFSGTTGDCTWAITGDEDDYTLTISGNGAMGEGDAPWGDFSGGIKTVVVENGVTHISDGVFSNYQNVTSVSIPNSVTSIGSQFFWMGANLTSVTIPSGLTGIPYGFLFKCSKLTSVTIPAGVQSLGGAAFADLLSLTTVTCLNPVPPTIPGNKEDSYEGIFRPKDEGDPDPAICTLRVPAGSVDDYKNSTWGSLARFTDIVAIGAPDLSNACDITTFTVGGENWDIDGANNITKTYPANTNVTNLTPTIAVSKGATVDPASGEAKDFSQDVTYTVTAENGTTTKTYTVKVTVDEGDPFSGTTGDCTWAITGDEDDYTLTISGNGAMADGAPWEDFSGGIKTVVVENGVTHISGSFLAYSTNLTSVTISSGLTGIPYGFLFKCSKLTSVTIPAGVQSLGGAAFADLLSLTTVTCLNPVPPTIPGNKEDSYEGIFRPKDGGDPDPAVCTLRVPAGSVQAYKDSSWGQLERFANIVAIE